MLFHGTSANIIKIFKNLSGLAIDVLTTKFIQLK